MNVRPNGWRSTHVCLGQREKDVHRNIFAGYGEKVVDAKSLRDVGHGNAEYLIYSA